MNRRNILGLLGGALVARVPPSLAQQSQLPVVGYLSSALPATYPPAYVAAFRQGLGEAGYIEGKNVTIEYRWAEDHYDRLPGLAEDLVRRKVNVIAATGGIVSTLAAKATTSTIPIAFAMGDDPVAAGIVASFARPGGNITGVSFFIVELGAKLIELAAELIPNTVSIGALANPKRPSYTAVRKTLEEAARATGRHLLVLDAASENDFADAFANLAGSRSGALVVTSDPFFLDRRERLVALAAQHSIPAVCAWRAFVAAGGLMSYGINLADQYRSVGVYVGRILKGEKPADLPVQQPTKFELVVNLKTAKALRLTVPRSILARADEVIE